MPRPVSGFRPLPFELWTVLDMLLPPGRHLRMVSDWRWEVEETGIVVTRRQAEWLIRNGMMKVTAPVGVQRRFRVAPHAREAYENGWYVPRKTRFGSAFACLPSPLPGRERRRCPPEL